MSGSQTHEYKHILPLLPASATWNEPITHDRFANQPMIRRIRAEMYASEAGTLYLDQSDAADMSGPTTVSLAVAADTTALFPWTKLTKRYYRWRFANDAAVQTARPILKAEESGRPVYDTYVEDGQDEALGAKVDTAATTDTGTFSLIALFKRLLQKWTAGITISGRNATVGNDLTMTWANSAAANTVVNSDIALPTNPNPDALYAVTVYNPSAVTALTLIAQVVETALGGGTRYGELTRFGVTAGGTKTVLVQGWMLGSSSRLVAQNDTILGAGDGFSAYARIRAV